MTIEHDVARHYAHGALEGAILDALKKAGKDVEGLTPDDLAAADEFHLGWRAATEALAADLGLAPAMHVLDVGSGLGGPARFFAHRHGCRVTGIDLTEEYVAVADALTRRCGLADRVAFRQGSALDLPFDAGAFDAATLIHVGMNIADKARLFAEVRRVLRPGARFGVYDIVRVADAELPYPMPWAASPATSFVETADTYRRLLAVAGFAVDAEHDRGDLARRLAGEMRADAAVNGAPALGLHVLMGPAARERLGNVMATLEKRLIAPTAFVARAV